MPTPFDPRALLDLPAPDCLRRVAGRETFLWRDAAGAPRVVKRYSHEAAAERWRERLLGGPGRSAGRREHDNLRALAALGLAVPEALSFCEERGVSGAPRRSLVVMEHVAHKQTLRERLAVAGQAERRALLAELLRLVAALHAAGWYHRDLYLQHLLLREADGALVLIDVGRARRARQPRPRWLVKDLAALLHSAPRQVRWRERLRFLAAWLDGAGIDGRACRRRWRAAIEAKARRMAAHVPRDERAALQR